MLALTLLYISIQVIAQGILGPALAHSTVPLADAMAPISQTLRLLMLAGAGLSMFGFISTELLCGPRILLALARDCLLPRALAKVNPRTHTPNTAILCHAALAIVFSPSGSFAGIASMLFLTALPSRTEILGMFGLFGLSAVVYLIRTRAARSTAQGR